MKHNGYDLHDVTELKAEWKCPEKDKYIATSEQKQVSKKFNIKLEKVLLIVNKAKGHRKQQERLKQANIFKLRKNRQIEREVSWDQDNY